MSFSSRVFTSRTFSSRLISPRGNRFDMDALDYFWRLDQAGSSIGPNALAVDTLIKGLKYEGLWNSLKSACLLAGPINLNGALVPIRADMPIPTNNNFVSADHSRTSGLLGNGSSKYLNTNRNNNVDGQDNQHLSVYVNTAGAATPAALIGIGNGSSNGESTLLVSAGGMLVRSRMATTASRLAVATATGLVGVSRAASGSFSFRVAGSTSIESVVSQTPLAGNIYVFARNNAGTAQILMDNRLAFYSVGEALDLTKLEILLSTFVASLL